MQFYLRNVFRPLAVTAGLAALSVVVANALGKRTGITLPSAAPISPLRFARMRTDRYNLSQHFRASAQATTPHSLTVPRPLRALEIMQTKISKKLCFDESPEYNYYSNRRKYGTSFLLPLVGSWKAELGETCQNSRSMLWWRSETGFKTTQDRLLSRSAFCAAGRGQFSAGWRLSIRSFGGNFCQPPRAYLPGFCDG